MNWEILMVCWLVGNLGFALGWCYCAVVTNNRADLYDLTTNRR